MKIGLLSKVVPPSLNNGGIGTYTMCLALELSEMGHQVHIFTMSNEVDYEVNPKLFVHCIGDDYLSDINMYNQYPVFNKNINYSYKVSQRIIEIKNKFGLDIVENSNWDCEGLLCVINKVVPIVTRLVSPLIEVAGLQGWEVGRDFDLSCMAEKYLIEHSDGVIYSTDPIFEVIKNLLAINFSKIKHVKIPFGIKVKDLQSNYERAESDHLNILFVGRLERRKGIHVLLDVIPGILKKREDVIFHIVGNDKIPDVDGELFRNKFEKKYPNLNDKVLFYGKVENDKLDILYKNCDIFVAPSLFESFGLIYLEAFQYAKSVIGCNVGGIPEIINNGKNGFMAEPDDKKSLVEAIFKLIDNKKMRLDLGSQGRRDLENKFDSRIMAERTLKFYQNLI